MKLPRILHSKKGVTLVELMIVITLAGTIAVIGLIALNVTRRGAQSRDAIRRQDISEIAKALGFYLAAKNTFPVDLPNCDSSIGYNGTGNCPPSGAQITGNWILNQGINQGVIVEEQVLKKLPVDPINNTTYYYSYEPKGPTQSPCGSPGSPGYTCRYWIGGRLENPTNPNNFFRCSDDETLAAGVGCKEVSAINL